MCMKENIFQCATAPPEIKWGKEREPQHHLKTSEANRIQTHAKGSYTLMHAHHVHIWTHTALCFMYTRVTTQPLTSLYCMSDWSFYALAWCLSSHDRHNMTSERWGVKGERSDMSYQWFNPPVPYDWHACPQTVRHQSGVTKGFNYFRNGPATVKDRSATAGQYSKLKCIETWPA